MWKRFEIIAGIAVASVVLGLGLAVPSASAGLAVDEAPLTAERDDRDGCGSADVSVYFSALESDVSDEAKALLVRLALMYMSCDVDRIEISSVAVESAAPDSTLDIAAARAESVASVLRFLFLGQAPLVVEIQRTDTAFGPETRATRVRLVT